MNNIKNLDLLIVGSGGNGQSYFMSFCNKNKIKINDMGDRDGLKHLSHPDKMPSNVNIKKCIFLYNDPYKSIQSHYRRGWALVQINKLGNPYNLNETNAKSLNEYNKQVLINQKDVFGIEYQFDNWYNTQINFPILFLDFNDILNCTDIIDNFLGTKLNYDLFSIQKRHINRVVSPEIVKIYDQLYDDIKSKIKIDKIIA